MKKRYIYLNILDCMFTSVRVGWGARRNSPGENFCSNKNENKNKINQEEKIKNIIWSILFQFYTV